MSSGALHVQEGQWPLVAKQFLSNIGHPLRPNLEDIRIYEGLIKCRTAGDSKTIALVLGVTPEIYNLSSKIFDHVFAIDRTEAMINYVWPGERTQVFQKDWTDLKGLPLQTDTIFCDGGLHLLGHPDQQGLLISGVESSLNQGGRFIARLFCPPKTRETSAEVLSALTKGNIPSMNHLKIRLGNAMQENVFSGVRLGDIWAMLDRALSDRNSFFCTLGWDKDTVDVIDLYKDSDARYHFMSVDQVVSLFSEHAPTMQLIDVMWPSYEMGFQFPVICFEKH